MAKRIEVENLDVYYGSFQAVAGVSLVVEPRTVTAFIGPSGCGKSTVLRTLNRMHEVIPGAYATGKVALDGVDLYGQGVDPVAVRRLVGMVFQRPNPFPSMTIYDNVAAGLKLNGTRNKKELDETVERSLRSANLWNEVKAKVSYQAAYSALSHRCRTEAVSPVADEPRFFVTGFDPSGTMMTARKVREHLTLAEAKALQAEATRHGGMLLIYKEKETPKPEDITPLD